MAKHFSDGAPQETEAMEPPVAPTRRRRSRDRGQMGGTGHVSLPYGQAATYHYSYPSAAVVGEDLYDEEEPPRGGINMVGRGLLLLLAWVIRLFALGMFCLVVLNVLSISSLEAPLERLTDAITRYLPWHTFGLLEVDTPFGGVFRGDLAIITVVLFVLDWIVCRIRASLR